MLLSAACRIGTAEVESALVAHPKCAEAAVVGYEHPIKGQGIYAYVTLMEGVEPTEDIRRELIQTVRSIIGAFAAPDVIHWVSQDWAAAAEAAGPNQWLRAAVVGFVLGRIVQVMGG